MEGDSASKKTENTVPVGRLLSMRPPRDLTLRGTVQGLRGDPLRRGGVKRTFAPVIPNVTVKKERLDVPVEPEKPKQNESSHSRGKGDNRGDRGGRGRGRGQGRGSNLVYQKSIFEEWSNNKPKVAGRPSLMGGGGGGGGGGGSCYSRGSSSGESSSSFVKVKHEMKDEGETDAILKDIYRDDFLDDESLSTTNPAMFPILLDIQKKECKEETVDLKTPLVPSSSEIDVKVKDEPKDLDRSYEPIHRKPKITVPWDSSLQQPTVEPVFTPVTSSKKLFFIHLPDILPGYPPSKNAAPSTSTGTSSQSNQTTGKSQPEAETEAHSLNDFSEGFLGKMRVRRSGKVEFQLGNVNFEGSPLPSTFLQEVVICEVENNPDPKSQKWGDMTVIGHIGHKIQFTPNIDSILDSISS